MATRRKCSICGTAVDTNNLHPNNDNFTVEETEKINNGDDSFAVVHVGCAIGQNSWSGRNPHDEDLLDGRTLIQAR